MQTLKKIQINPRNLLRNEELRTLRGGQSVDCALYFGGDFIDVRTFLCYGSQNECDELCASAYSDTHPDAWCFCNIGY